ncbi:MAG: hypothetical protein SF172_14620 [Burkholderiales bacterium]|nr:hypothetical protein [Burkholderiales bacterium]
MKRKPIYLTQLGTSPGNVPAPEDDHALLRRAFDSLTQALHTAYSQRHGGAATADDCITLLALLREFLDFMARVDREHGADGPLSLVDTDLACADAMRATAALESWLNRLDLAESQAVLDSLILGIALWAMRHDCLLHVPEPVVNALARLANGAASRQDVAAAFAMMQGVIEHLKPQLAADLEQSNPERPWRMLHLNFAITGIRSGDVALASHAFSALNAGLPHERAGFYEEALRIAQHSGLPDEMTGLIMAQHEAAAPRH